MIFEIVVKSFHFLTKNIQKIYHKVYFIEMH